MTQNKKKIKWFIHWVEWVAIPFSMGSSQPREWTQVSLIAGRFFTVWATREAFALLGQCFCQFYRWKLNLQLTTKEYERISYLLWQSTFFEESESLFLLECMNIYIIPSICIPVFFWLIHMQWGSCTLRILIHFSAINVKFVVWLLILFLAFWCIKFLCN